MSSSDLTPGGRLGAGAPADRKAMTVSAAAFLGIGGMVGAGIFALLGEAGADRRVGGLALVSCGRLRRPAPELLILEARRALPVSRRHRRVPGAGVRQRARHRNHLLDVLLQRRNRHVYGDCRVLPVTLGELLSGNDPSTLLRNVLVIGLVLIVVGINVIGPQLVARAQTLVVWAVIALLVDVRGGPAS